MEHTLGEGGTVSVTFDADTCSDWQRNSDNEFVRVLFWYAFEASELTPVWFTLISEQNA